VEEASSSLNGMGLWSRLYAALVTTRIHSLTSGLVIFAS